MSDNALKDAVLARDVAGLEAAIAAGFEWWQVIWALQACADLDLIEHARLLVPHAQSPRSLEPALVRALRQERGRALFEVLLGEGDATPERRAVEDAAYRAAVRYGNAAAAELLRARGATDAALRDVDRAIAGAQIAAPFTWADHVMLSWAIEKHHVDRVPHLLAIGLDPNTHDEAGLLPIHHARDQATIAALLAAGADPDGKRFADMVAPAHFEAAVHAVIDGDLAALKALLDAHPDLVWQRSPRAHRCTLLHYTAANGTEVQKSPKAAPQIAEELLARGADPNATCLLYGGGSDALGLMITSAHPRAAKVDGELIRVYVKYGARIHPSTMDTAVQCASPLAVQALVDAGMRVTLLVAAALGRIDLVDEAVDVNTRFADGYTALHAAAGMGHAEMVSYLLARGADTTAVDTRWGGTPADKARYFEHPLVAALLT